MTTPRAERPDMSDYGVPSDLADDSQRICTTDDES